MSKFETACVLIAKNGYNSQTYLLTAELFNKSLDTVKAKVEAWQKILETKPAPVEEKAEG